MRSNLGLLCFGMMIAAVGCQLVDNQPTGSSGAAGSADPTGSSSSTGGGDDACKGVPTEGQCVGTGKIQSCFVSEEGSTPPQIIETTCGAQTECRIVNGSAACKPTGACFNGATA